MFQNVPQKLKVFSKQRLRCLRLLETLQIHDTILTTWPSSHLAPFLPPQLPTGKLPAWCLLFTGLVVYNNVQNLGLISSHTCVEISKLKRYFNFIKRMSFHIETMCNHRPRMRCEISHIVESHGGFLNKSFRKPLKFT